jgi:hypothetical protein
MMPTTSTSSPMPDARRLRGTVSPTATPSSAAVELMATWPRTSRLVRALTKLLPSGAAPATPSFSCQARTASGPTTLRENAESFETSFWKANEVALMRWRPDTPSLVRPTAIRVQREHPDLLSQIRVW